MSEHTTKDLQRLIDRLGAGDTDARHELLTHAYERLRRLAGALFYRSFPDLQQRHELDSVLNDTWPRLLQALEKTRPATVADFFRLAAHKMHQVLLDMAERHRRLAQREFSFASASSAHHNVFHLSDSTDDPVVLALWTEFHQALTGLSEPERAVFEMHYYLDLPQVEIARILNVSPRKVSYLWVAATDKLAESLPDSGQND